MRNDHPKSNRSKMGTNARYSHDEQLCCTSDGKCDVVGWRTTMLLSIFKGGVGRTAVYQQTSQVESMAPPKQAFNTWRKGFAKWTTNR